MSPLKSDVSVLFIVECYLTLYGISWTHWYCQCLCLIFCWYLDSTSRLCHVSIPAIAQFTVTLWVKKVGVAECCNFPTDATNFWRNFDRQLQFLTNEGKSKVWYLLQRFFRETDLRPEARLQSRKWQLIGVIYRSALCGHLLLAPANNWTHGLHQADIAPPQSATQKVIGAKNFNFAPNFFKEVFSATNFTFVWTKLFPTRRYSSAQRVRCSLSPLPLCHWPSI